MRGHTKSASSPLLVAAMVGLLGLGGLGLIAVTGEAGDDPSAGPQTVVIEPSYPYDYSDERILVAVASHVSLGQVIEQVDTKGIPTSAPDIEIPQTQFSVKVLKAIKGELPDVVTVSQGSGVDKSTGDLLLLDGDPLLEPGETVLFVTNFDPDFDWYSIVGGPFGASRAKDAAAADALVSRFQQAARNEFVPVPVPNFVPPDEQAKSR